MNKNSKTKAFLPISSYTIKKLCSLGLEMTMEIAYFPKSSETLNFWNIRDAVVINQLPATGATATGAGFTSSAFSCSLFSI